MTQQPELALSAFAVIADGLDHPEGVAAGPDGRLYAGGEGGQLYRIGPAGAEEFANTGGFVLGLALDADSNIYACDLGRHEVVHVTQAGIVTSYSARIGVPNFPVFTDDGHLFVSDSGRWMQRDGGLFLVAPGGTTTRVSVDVADFPNGLAITSDGRWLYVVLSTVPGVARLPLDGHTVTGPAELLVELPAHVPDGIAFAANGDLLIACYAPDVVYRWDGTTLSTLVSDPLRTDIAAPTNAAFYGPELDKLALASLGRWHITATTSAGRGARLRYPHVTDRTDPAVTPALSR